MSFSLSKNDHFRKEMVIFLFVKYTNKILTTKFLAGRYFSPFGSVMKNRSNAFKDYRYGFQNQEKDDEIFGEGNGLSYKYRIEDTRLGRFFGVDPIAKDFPWNSSYAFSENKVINSIELEGLESVIAIDGTHYNNGPVDLYNINKNLATANPSLLEPANLSLVNQKISETPGLDQGPYPIPIVTRPKVSGPTIGPCNDCGSKMREIRNENAKKQEIFDAYKNKLMVSEPILSGQFGGANQYPTILEGAGVAFGPEGLLLDVAGYGLKALTLPARTTWNEVKALKGFSMAQKGMLWGAYKSALYSYNKTIDAGLLIIDVSLTVQEVSGLLTKEAFSAKQQQIQKQPTPTK